MEYLMKCGHVNNAECNGKPCCVICGCVEVEREVQGTDGLTGRFAKCSDCSSKVPSKWSLPFFSYSPDEEFDSYYCGCYGWD